ncbi:PP2C family protein-serine/threonine phosphatase [Actinokineospora xionganensis]|uniref:Protein phosphatase 2C domain-containing protein n=1 Tax=Actinokineospora xionganensis TaxID=2684470 RepID=A0ABR7L7X7_9PSEU|nr:protein phosphatase 2C domain-containing protein [Actinokineospora xionganensis]MBC6448801.1 protein phosphatase 2C domain-containing protein [Actinokineospora xionganensis]
MTTTTGCVSCGGTVAPDGYCWHCGTGQPGFRARLEITADNGAAGVSDRGLRRGVNADAVALGMVDTWTLGVVCDGVSMSPRAERAAQVAAETGLVALAATLRGGAIPEVALVGAALRAGRAVCALAESVHAAPACTYVAGICGPAGMWAGSVGDSRAYWLPDEGPGMVLTEDDTADDEVLAAWLGADADEPAPRIRSHRPRGPGWLLLCTDGLWRYLPTAESLRATLCGPSGLDNARSLVGYALDAGGHDNVTALLMRAQVGVEPVLPTAVTTMHGRNQSAAMDPGVS